VLFMAPFLLAAALGLDSNQSNTAYTGVNPIRIASCSLDPVFSYQSDGDGDVISTNQIGTDLDVNFTNIAEKPISSVTFAIGNGGGSTNRVVDAGTFSPGVTITHALPLSYLDSGTATCSVNSVAFSDGSTWMQPAVGADSGKN
jgi:hypothetical protein